MPPLRRGHGQTAQMLADSATQLDLHSRFQATFKKAIIEPGHFERPGSIVQNRPEQIQTRAYLTPASFPNRCNDRHQLAVDQPIDGPEVGVVLVAARVIVQQISNCEHADFIQIASALMGDAGQCGNRRQDSTPGLRRNRSRARD
ncbi:MAG: hypothetical protein BWY63_02139 [Chloroflexi bacterium ADurb.Bin360]|nr:MAG: hypothetical protein BWY63_02139 [Chloroflexi bacterium ADurb.Bin360]